MSHTRSLLALAATFGLAGCGGHDEPAPPLGADSFESATGDTRGVYGPPEYGGEDDGTNDRVVEEADIYRFVGDRLYVLNQFRGLYCFDVSEPDRPLEIGRLPLSGTPVEMYVQGDRAYAILSDDVGYRWYGVADAAASETDGLGLEPVFGSRIVGIDLSQPEDPILLGEVELDGWVSDTRKVGDVIYAAANRWSWWNAGWGVGVDVAEDAVAPDEAGDNEVVVTSIDVSQPAAMQQVAQLTLPGSGWWVQASPDAFVVAGERWDETEGAQTEIAVIDISSPTGEMALAGTTRVSGSMREDTALDLHAGQLRVLTREWMTNLTKLRILDATQPETLPVLGELEYFYDGALFGTTFDGDRLYMVHYMRIDPLEVVDLSDPTNPVIAGILEMPGWVDRIAPLGDRLVGLGTDDTDGLRRTSVSLFDVADPAAPALLDRVTSGPDWSWSVASWERKAWTVDEKEGLILFPYSGWSEGESRMLYALGILELGATELTPRGEVIAPADVERAALHADHVYAISQAALQVVDLTDRDQPVATATVELARSVSDYVRTEGAGAELVQAGLGVWWGWGGDGGSLLRVTPLDAPDGAQELARISLPQTAQTLLAHQDLVVAIRTWDTCAGWTDREGSVCEDSQRAGAMVVSLADPRAPRVLADLPLPSPDPLPPEARDEASQWASWQARYGAPLGGWQGGAPALDLGGGRYGLLRTTSTTCWTVDACRALGIEPQSVDGVTDVPPSGEDPDPDAKPGDSDARDTTWAWGWRTDTALAVLDLSDAGSPQLHGPFALGAGVVEGAFTVGDVLVYSVAVPSRVAADGRTFVRYYMERRRVGADGTVTVLPSINVPGVVVALRDGGRTALTLDRQWTSREDWSGWGQELWLNALRVEDDVAVRTAILRLGDELASLAVADGLAYAVRSEYVEPEDPETPYWEWRQTWLSVIDVTDRHVLELGNELPLGDGWWSIAAVGPSMLALSGGYQGGLALFDRSSPEVPVYDRFVRTLGWTVSILQEGDTLYLSGGPYGIQVVQPDETAPQ